MHLPKTQIALYQNNHNYTIAPQEHLSNEPLILLRLHLAISVPDRCLPHEFRALEDHVAVAVEGLDAREDLDIVAHAYEDLLVVADGGLDDGEGAGGEFVLFELGDFVFAGEKGELV
jgi:hypothetical protein